MSTIKIISTQKISVMRDLAFNDRTPDLANVGTAVISGQSLMRVNTLSPITYAFNVGSNEVPEPYTFTDPTTREKVSESILDWPGVRYLIKRGVLEAFTDEGVMTVDKLEAKDVKKAKAAEKKATKKAKEPKPEPEDEPEVKTTSKKSMSDLAKK